MPKKFPALYGTVQSGRSLHEADGTLLVSGSLIDDAFLRLHAAASDCQIGR
jgi:hypothetical protein